MSDDYIARITKPEYLRATFGTPDRREVYKMQIKNNDRGLANQRAKLQLPYYAPNHPPLPSRAEIEAAFESSIIPNMLGGYPVCRVGQCMVKFSSDMVIWQVSCSCSGGSKVLVKCSSASLQADAGTCIHPVQKVYQLNSRKRRIYFSSTRTQKSRRQGYTLSMSQTMPCLSRQKEP
jgi:hypothetical protein